MAKDAVYTHKCKFCGHTWTGRKKEFVACVRCKRRKDYPVRLEGKRAALQYIEELYMRNGYAPSKARKEATETLKHIQQNQR